MHESNLVLNDWRLQAGGDVTIESLADNKAVSISAPGSGGTISLNAAAQAEMTVGTSAVILSESDGAVLIGGQKAVKIGAGSAVNTAIEMTMDAVVISLTPLVSIKVSQTGIEITAGVNKLTVGVEGITLKGVMLTEKAEAVRQVDQGLSKDASQGPRQIQAALDTLI